ncbi:MAG: membrane protein insertase YidC, partial [Desulfobacteraceae bacterium]
MEKRTVIAFALSFVVLLVWSTLFAPTGERQRSEPTSPEQATEKVETKAGKDPGEEPSPAPSPPQPETGPPDPIVSPAEPASEKRGEEIRIETPLYSAVWNSAGGILKSFKLKAYRQRPDPDSPPVELAHLNGVQGGLLGLHFAPRPEGGPIMYNADKTSIKLEEGSNPQELTLAGRTEDGLVLEHTFRFHPASYRIEVRTRVVNNGEEPVEGALAAELRNIPPESRQSYYGFVGLAVLLGNDVEEVKPKDLEEEQKRLSGPIKWMAFEDDYFMAAVVPQDGDDGSFLGRRLPSGAVNGFYFKPSMRLNPQESASSNLALYMGPRDLTMLKAFGNDLDKALSFGFTDVIAKPL